MACKEGNSFFAERLIRTLKNKIYKYMTAISKNIFTDKFLEIVEKYHNAILTSIKMKPVNVEPNTCIGFNA